MRSGARWRFGRLGDAADKAPGFDPSARLFPVFRGCRQDDSVDCIAHAPRCICLSLEKVSIFSAFHRFFPFV
jgi:hypothetical protein